jgi:hypothetical protein
MKRLIITEEEKNRILGLHKQFMIEQPVADAKTYATNMAVNALSQPISTKKGVMTPSTAGQKTETIQQKEIGQPIMDPAKDLNIGTTYITFADENGDVTNKVNDGNGTPIYCKVIKIVDNVASKQPLVINNIKYKIIKATNIKTNKPCGDLTYNDEDGWMAVFVDTQKDGNNNIVSGYLGSPSEKQPEGSRSFDSPYARSNEYSLFSVPKTQSNTNTPAVDSTKNATQSNTIAPVVSTTKETPPQNNSQAKINTTNDRAYDYKLEDGKYYFKGKDNTNYGKKYPNWVEAKGEGLKAIKAQVKF